MPNSPDDLEGLQPERDAADREYNEALTRLDRNVDRLNGLLFTYRDYAVIGGRL